jgi:hypothetical protein
MAINAHGNMIRQIGPPGETFRRCLNREVWHRSSIRVLHEQIPQPCSDHEHNNTQSPSNDFEDFLHASS